MAFLRVQTGVFDPAVVGDKSKWYSQQYEPLSFPVWDEASSLDGALRALGKHDQIATGNPLDPIQPNSLDYNETFPPCPVDESGSDSEGAGSSSSSYSSLSELMSEITSDISPSHYLPIN